MTSTIKNIEGIKIFSCGSNHKLAEEIASSLGVNLASSEVGQFSDGESYVRINEIVRGIDCFVVQPMSSPVNNNLMELLIMIDALRRASAGRITAVCPYYGYARQDRKTRARDPISARLVADLLQTAGADRIVAMDLHCAQIQGFFTIPVDHMLGNPLLIKYYKEKFKDDNDVVVVSPDIGSVKRSRTFAESIDAPLAIIDKRRPEDNVSEVMNIIGDSVEGKKVIMVDDMIDTAGTICNAANAIKKHGAAEVYACCTHAVLSGPAIERIEKSSINELVVLDTIALPKEKQIDKIKQLSVADILAEAIYRINANESVSQLFS